LMENILEEEMEQTSPCDPHSDRANLSFWDVKMTHSLPFHKHCYDGGTCVNKDIVTFHILPWASAMMPTFTDCFREKVHKCLLESTHPTLTVVP
jgi:prepilin-type processing-associated H-X9-DG protein